MSRCAMNEILFRNNEQYLGREFFFKREIVQVIGPSNEVYNFRVRILGDPAASPARRRLRSSYATALPGITNWTVLHLREVGWSLGKWATRTATTRLTSVG